MGRHGKKYRWLLKGAKNAMPRPPFVMASRRPCEAVTPANQTKSTNNGRCESDPGRCESDPGRCESDLGWCTCQATRAPANTAKKSEWVNPRCPNMSS